MSHTREDLDAYEALALELAAFAIGEIGGRRVNPDERSTKDHAADWVTTVDVGVERHVRREISQRFPDHAIVGEELGSSGDPSAGGLVWYVDPIDGTTNFVHSLPWSSFSLCLADDEGLLLGVVADPHRQEVLSARRGAGSRIDGAATRCRDADTLVGGALLTELAGVECWPGFFELAAAVSRHKCVTRVMGSCALSLASLAAGRASAVVLSGWNPIDVGAGVLAARESGAVVLAGPGAPHVLGAGGLEHDLLVAVAPGATRELTEILEGLPTR